MARKALQHRDKPGQFTTEVHATKVAWFKKGFLRAVKVLGRGYTFIFFIGALLGFALGLLYGTTACG